MEYNNFTDIITLEPVYITDDGLEFIDPNDNEAIQKQIDAKTFQMVFHFQTVDCACIYGILTNRNWTYTMDIYHYLRTHPYNKVTLFKLLTKGEFDIGISRINSYHRITEIMAYNDEDNREMHLHYTTLRSHEGNVARHSLNWDLFESIVDYMNEQGDE